MASTGRYRFGHSAPVERQGLVELVASRGDVNALGDGARARVLAAAGDFAAGLPERVDFPYVTEVLTARLGPPKMTTTVDVRPRPPACRMAP